MAAGRRCQAAVATGRPIAYSKELIAAQRVAWLPGSCPRVREDQLLKGSEMLLKTRWRSVLWVCLLLVTAGAFAAGTRAAAPVGPQPQHDWKQVTLLYLSDVKGKIEPCG